MAGHDKQVHVLAHKWWQLGKGHEQDCLFFLQGSKKAQPKERKNNKDCPKQLRVQADKTKM